LLQAKDVEALSLFFLWFFSSCKILNPHYTGSCFGKYLCPAAEDRLIPFSGAKEHKFSVIGGPLTSPSAKPVA
jgi:hypothetical protein